MKTISHKISLAINSILVGSSAFALTPLTSCGGNGAIQLANFESYMSDDLCNDLQSKYSIQFPYYTVTEMIETKFEKYYDIAIPSCYEMIALVRRGWVEKLDWSKFNVKNMAGETIHNATEAKTLFKSDIIDKLNQQFAEYILACAIESLMTGKLDDLVKHVYEDGTWNIETPGEFNVLNYGVPYFSQSYTFCYKGSVIDFYRATGNHEKIDLATSKPTWADIFYTISPANPKLDPRFNPDNGHRIGLVDDAKTMYDVSRIIETTIEAEDPMAGTNTIPEDDSTPRMLKTFSYLTDMYKNKSTSWFVVNSDSGVISKLLADPKGCSAALSWSGDAIYGAQGAEEYAEYSSDNFHFQKTEGASLDETEFMVINKKNKPKDDTKPSALKTRHDQIYEIVRQICLDGCDKDVHEICRHVDDKQDNLFQYWTMVNFDNVCYTPVLNNVYQAVTDVDSDYWKDCETGELTHPLSSIQLYTDILKVDIADPKCNHLYGQTITALQNSNNHWAWIESRAKL